MNYWCEVVLYCVVVINCAFKKKKLKQWKISGAKWVICQLNWPCEEAFFPYISHVILAQKAYPSPVSFFLLFRMVSLLHFLPFLSALLARATFTTSSCYHLHLPTSSASPYSPSDSHSSSSSGQKQQQE